MELATCCNGVPQAMIGGVIARDGAVIFPDSLTQYLSYDNEGRLLYIDVEVPPTPGTDYPGGSYRQSFVYEGGRLAEITRWEGL